MRAKTKVRILGGSVRSRIFSVFNHLKITCQESLETELKGVFTGYTVAIVTRFGNCRSDGTAPVLIYQGERNRNCHDSKFRRRASDRQDVRISAYTE